MKTTVNYAKSPAPMFDAVEDVKDYLGERYDDIASQMRHVTDPARFAFYCSFAGIEGLPVRAWFEHFHGQGSWKDFD